MAAVLISATLAVSSSSTGSGVYSHLGLPNVKLIEVWNYYDGPLYGICEVDGHKFFFQDKVFDIWRYYSEDDHERLWRIFAVYDIDVYKAREMTSNALRAEWNSELYDTSEVIGIFWEYSK